jgi:hypothetical protein
MNSTSRHTPEPWTQNGTEILCGGKVILTAEHSDAMVPHNELVKACACVNALAGLNPEAVAGVVAALEAIAEDRVQGGMGKRSVGQWFYQDKLANVQASARAALDALKGGAK